MLTEQEAFLRDLMQHGLFLPTGVQGVYGLGLAMSELMTQLDGLLSRCGRDDNTEIMRFPPVASRELVKRAGYMFSFPNLLGLVHTLPEDYTGRRDFEDIPLEAYKSVSDVVLCPAACYPVYPAVSGCLPPGGRTVDVDAICFRNEPSNDPARLQSFRLREFVRIGDRTTVLAWLDDWKVRGLRFVEALQIPGAVVPASDPFFGAGGRLMAAVQLEEKLKYEMVAPASSSVELTAIMSFNFHRELFGEIFDIRLADDSVAFSGCVGFGMERIALALYRAHGFEYEEWPEAVRKLLWQ